MNLFQNILNKEFNLNDLQIIFSSMKKLELISATDVLHLKIVDLSDNDIF